MKDNIIFGLFDVLLLKNSFHQTYLCDYLEALQIFCKNQNKEMFLITGLKEEATQKLIDKNSLFDFFSKDNIINITKEYEDSLSELDKKMKQQNYAVDFFYVDDYFKVFFLNNQFKKSINHSFYVGSDVWTDGYYLKRYVNMDFILIEEYLKNNNKEVNKDIFSDLYIFNPSLEDIKNHLTQEVDYKYESLERYAKKYLHSELLGKDFNIFSNNNVRDFVLKYKK